MMLQWMCTMLAAGRAGKTIAVHKWAECMQLVVCCQLVGLVAVL